MNQWTQNIEGDFEIIPRPEVSPKHAEINGEMFEFEEELPPHRELFFGRVTGRMDCYSMRGTHLDPPEEGEEIDPGSLRGALYEDDEGSEGELIRHLSEKESLELLWAGGYQHVGESSPMPMRSM